MALKGNCWGEGTVGAPTEVPGTGGTSGGVNSFAVMNQDYSHLYTDIVRTSNNSTKEKVLGILKKKGDATTEELSLIEGKLKGRHILLDNPESKRLKKSKSIKCSTNVFRAAQRRQAGQECITALKYDQVLPINRLWEGYMRRLISVTQKGNLEHSLIKADYHGAFVRVIQSKCPAFVGTSGIILQETMNTFVLVRPNQEKPVVTIPKKGSVFSCSLIKDDGQTLDWHLFGDQLCQHSGFRSSKKFKSKASVSL